ncbi:MAG TPA: hypothetical protein VKB80_13445 [Kofleriaceae bacterium]|nr:hypothetical protein [Kofleriaceae bacterium]
MGPRLTALAITVAAVAAAIAGTACDGGGFTRAEADHSQIQLLADKLAVKTGPVGEGKFRSDATYALIEARNDGGEDLDVTLAGELIDRSGTTTWPVRRESLRVPAGGSRLFALIDDHQAARPQATGARIEVVGAAAARHRPSFVLSDGKVVMDQDRAVAAAYLVNTAKNDGSVVLIGAFFDRDGAPLERTSTLFRLSGGGKRGVQLVGPPGSRSAYLFVGDFAY